MLDHMQQQLGGNNCPSSLQCWVYRYVMAIVDKQTDKLFQLSG
jgi:hypothetical protein